MAIPAALKQIVEAEKQRAVAKWNENTIFFFSRALVNRAVSIGCQIAGFDEAQEWFEAKTIYFIAEGLRCLAKAREVQEMSIDAG